MDERADHGTEPPPPVAAALAAADVFIAPTTRSLSHTQARKRAIRRRRPRRDDAGRHRRHARARDGGRLRHDGGALRGGRRRCSSAPSEAHVTCPLGSDLRLDLSGRAGISDDGDLTAPGAFGNLPCGEGFIAPAGGEGTIVASSLAPLGLSDGARAC